MNFLILGGNGYLGSKVVRLLVNSGNSVTCTIRPLSDRSRLKDLQDRIIWIPASKEGIENALKSKKHDYVLNLACSYEKPNSFYSDILEANLEFPLMALSCAVECGVKKYLTIGTSLPPSFNMYSFSKNILGKYGEFYVSKKGITFHNLLLEMFYGADEPDTRFLPSVIKAMLIGGIVDTTLGTQHRDIICSSDVVSAIMMVINSNLNGYNEIPVGTGVSPSISEIIDFMWSETGRVSVVRKGEIPMRDDEPDCVADTRILDSLGGWHPIPWRLGLKSMIEEIKKKDKSWNMRD